MLEVEINQAGRIWLPDSEALASEAVSRGAGSHAAGDHRAARTRDVSARSGPRQWFGFPQATLTIRQSILLGFVLMCVVTAAVGAYSAAMIRQSAALVVETFDRSLMSIDYARAASADFAGMQTAFLRLRLASEGPARDQLQATLRDLAQTFYEDLDISAERSQSARARRAGDQVRRSVDRWETASKALDNRLSLTDVLFRLDGAAASVSHDMDIFINVTAGDGFLYRQQALREIRTETALSIAATVAGLLVSAAVAWFLHRRIAGPISDASAIAVRIAARDLSVEISDGRRDELGTLLRSMATMRDSIRDMMQAEVSQRRSAQARLMDAVQTMQEGVVLVDAAGQIVLTNAPVTDFFGKPEAGSAPSLTISDLLRTLARSRLSDESLLSAGAITWPLDRETPGTTELGLRDGTWLRVSWCATREGGLVAFFSDVTLAKRREAQLAQTNLWFDAALTHMSQGLCVYDSDGLLKVFNTRFCEIYQLGRGQIVPGMRFDDDVQPMLEALSQTDSMQNGEADTALLPAHIALRRIFAGHQFLVDGRVIALSHRPISDGGWVLAYEDVTARYRSDARVAFLAGHDSLTTLPNRTLFNERLDHAFAHFEEGGAFALLLIDLDRFKEVNDTRGHPVGDSLLRVVAERLQGCARHRDTVARLGGDEFAIIQHGVRDEVDAQELAARILDVMGAPFTIDGIRLEIGASIGIAIAGEHGTSQEILLRCADTALYRVKNEGRHNFRLFSPSMDTALQDRRALEHDLLNTHLDGEMELLYQPIMSLQHWPADGLDGLRQGGLRPDALIGFEALLRWNHPTRGLLMPGDFVGLSEDTGFIERLGAWIMMRACTDAVGWPRDLKVAINVSPIQFRSGRLTERLREALQGSSILPSRVELEITETTLLHDNEATLETLRQLHVCGVQIALDDFGTGFSSLSYLRSFPFDRLKIDRSFVTDMCQHEDAAAIIRAILGLGRSLHIPVTAEGVETVEQLARLREEGCAQAQGYLFSAPVPAHEVARLMSPAAIET